MPRIVICKECGREKEHHARGLCPNCYKRCFSYPRNREAIKAQQRAYHERNREAIKARHWAYRARNSEAIKIRHRAYYERNREAIKAQTQAYYERNREPIKAWNRVRYERNREAIKAQTQAYYERNREPIVARKEIRRRIRGKIPRYKCVGPLNPSWRGGRIVFCSICGVPIGWRVPAKIKKNKTGFRCKEHRNVRLKPREENDEHQEGKGDSEVRSSVA